MHAQWCRLMLYRLMLYQSVYKTKHLLCIRIVIQIQLKNVISNTLILKNCYNNSAQEKNAYILNLDLHMAPV